MCFSRLYNMRMIASPNHMQTDFPADGYKLYDYISGGILHTVDLNRALNRDRIHSGCGAGYDTKIYGLEWVSQTSVDHTIRVTDRYPMHPLFKFGINPLEHCTEVKWEFKTGEQTDKKRITDGYCETPYGIIETRYEERPMQDAFCLKNIIKDIEAAEGRKHIITAGDY